MARIKITKAAEQHTVRVSNTDRHAEVPIDGGFHEIDDSLLPVLDDSAVEYEKENADATSGSAVSGRRGKAGGPSRAAKPKAKAKATAKAKAK